jgi:hypothetical protein
MAWGGTIASGRGRGTRARGRAGGTPRGIEAEYRSGSAIQTARRGARLFGTADFLCKKQKVSLSVRNQ